MSNRNHTTHYTYIRSPLKPITSRESRHNGPNRKVGLTDDRYAKRGDLGRSPRRGNGQRSAKGFEGSSVHLPVGAAAARQLTQQTGLCVDDVHVHQREYSREKILNEGLSGADSLWELST